MIELLWQAEGPPGLDLPDELGRLYGGGLALPDPGLVANFVQTVDGVVSIPALERSNALIADESAADRFLMGLLRACADAVLVGSATMLASPRGTWLPERAYPPAGGAFAELRRRLGKPPAPTVAVVTAGGSLDPGHPALEREAIVLTTCAAAPALRAVVPAGSEVVPVTGGDWVDGRDAVAALHERGHTLLLSEGGPNLFASLLAAGVVDELFLTLSPVLAGRAPGDVRLSLVEGLAFLPQARAAGTLRSVRRHEGHLFLRYGLRG